MSWCIGGKLFEDPVPTLFRFLVVIAILAGLGLAAVFVLATFVQPDIREITVPIPANRLPSK
ncbi:histidine kinase [Microvirga flavescens]|uniref:histidine kinase n=1 Tax=Microvirga flavescens TaxID=2249811 RepID=UPI003CCA80C6